MRHDPSREAWAEELACHAPWLRLYVAHRAGKAVRVALDAEDVVQEVFVRALADAKAFRRAAAEAAEDVWLEGPSAKAASAEGASADGGSGQSASAARMHRTRAVLARLATEVLLDSIRRLRALKRGGGARAVRLASSSSTSGLAASALAATATGPATAVARRESADALAAALLRLSPEHRRVIGFRQIEGLSAAEAARRMCRSEAAVHSLYRRALEAWAQEMGGAPPA